MLRRPFINVECDSDRSRRDVVHLNLYRRVLTASLVQKVNNHVPGALDSRRVIGVWTRA